MSDYMELAPDMGYRLINHGPVILLSTRDSQGGYDVAPIAWCSPARKEPPKLLVVVGRGHKSYQNLIETGEFIVCVPHARQVELVRRCGRVSGHEVDKFEALKMGHFPGKIVDAHVPEGCIGYLECKLFDTLALDKTDIIVGDIVAASARPDVFTDRLLVETPAGKTLHHLGGNFFATPGDTILSQS